jgi:hypothetical protein
MELTESEMKELKRMVPRTEGTYTLKQIRDAGHKIGFSDAAEEIIAVLYPPPKPTKQDAAVEAVREVLAPYRDHSRPEIELSIFEAVVAAVRKADQEPA